MIPQDPAMLLSYVNTWMRDQACDFEEFLGSHALSAEDGAALCDRLAAIGYHLDEEKRRFV